MPGTICHGYEPSAGIPKKSGDVKFFSRDLTWNYPEGESIDDLVLCGREGVGVNEVCRHAIRALCRLCMPRGGGGGGGRVRDPGATGYIIGKARVWQGKEPWCVLGLRGCRIDQDPGACGGAVDDVHF